MSGFIPGRSITRMTINDAEHYSEEERNAIIAGYPPHEREARVKGVPSMGSGRVFPVAQSEIEVTPFAIPSHWVQINGLDFGWDHPTAAVNCAYDRDADCFYVCKDYQKREATPIIHAASIKPWGDWIPTAWPHDGLQHDKGSGETLRDQYLEQGVNMLDDRATFENGGNSVEAGILDMLQRMQTGRWKVFSTCSAWFASFLIYHRVDGLIVKKKDDVLDASRYALMMKRHAINGAPDEWTAPKVNKTGRSASRW